MLYVARKLWEEQTDNTDDEESGHSAEDCDAEDGPVARKQLFPSGVFGAMSCRK